MAKSTVESSIETVLNVARTGIIKVLHVDDDQGFLKVAKQCLEMQGEFEADNASSVNEALEKLNKTEYDVVVSDYQMPSKGAQFTITIRRIGSTEKGNYQVQKTQQRQKKSATNMEVPKVHSQPHS